MSNTIHIPEPLVTIATRQPPETRGRKPSLILEKIMLLEPGQVAEVRGTLNYDSIRNRLGSKKEQEKTGRKFTIRKVESGVDVYRIS